MKIVKRDGRIVDYDRNKIKRAIERANNDVIETERVNDKQIENIIKHIEQLNKKPLEDFEIYGYEVIEADGTSTVTETKEIKGVIDPTTEVDSNGEKKRNIRILFRWNDENADTTDSASVSGFNNLEDTQFKGEADTSENADGLHTILKYKATVKFTQYIEPTV